jgi:hypothetical protein
VPGTVLIGSVTVPSYPAAAARNRISRRAAPTVASEDFLIDDREP